MANPYYTQSGNPGTGAAGASAPMRSEFAALQAAVDKLPTLSGNANAFVVVNPGATGLSVISGWVMTMNSFTVGMVANASVTLQLPAINGTLALVSQITSAVAALKTNIQVFNSTGTYTPSANMVFCIIECIAGGGGGASSASQANLDVVGGGGGAGSYSRKKATAADIGVSKAVTIGAAGTGATAGANDGGSGGDTSVGALCIGKGGSGGTHSVSSGAIGAGGAGGIQGTGDFSVEGNAGFCGSNINYLNAGYPAAGGNGGSGIFGGGTNTTILTSASTVGAAAKANSGSGGNAAWCINTVDSAGGAGGSGKVIITEFLSA